MNTGELQSRVKTVRILSDMHDPWGGQWGGCEHPVLASSLWAGNAALGKGGPSGAEGGRQGKRGSMPSVTPD